jgi:hypothetical protein
VPWTPGLKIAVPIARVRHPKKKPPYERWVAIKT